MAIWKVTAIWREDDAEAREQWHVSADAAHEAIREASAHFRFPPHHVEARLIPDGPDSDLRPGEVRRSSGG